MSAMSSNYRARRVRSPSSGMDSWTVIGSDLRPVAPVDEYLGWLTGIERSPNTVEAYARDLVLFFTFLGERGSDWQTDVDFSVLGEFAAWARRPAANVVPMSEQAARRTASTVNRMLTSVVGFYEFHGRRAEHVFVNLWEGRIGREGDEGRGLLGDVDPRGSVPPTTVNVIERQRDRDRDNDERATHETDGPVGSGATVGAGHRDRYVLAPVGVMSGDPGDRTGGHRSRTPRRSQSRASVRAGTVAESRVTPIR
jgi:hypothetical protein